jgi:HEAT repeat protein
VRLALAFGQEHASEGHIQSAVLEVCGLAGTPPAVDAILSGLQSDSDRIRHSAARALQRLPSETAAARLAQAVEAAPVPKRPVLLTLLGDLGSPVALPVIRNQTAADDPAVRAAAVRALGNIRGAETLPQLLTFLDDAREGVAAAAAEALATRRDDTVGAALAQAAAGAPPAPRAAMIKVLARRLDVGQVDTVLRSATDADAGVRLAAMKALEVLAAPEQAGPMVELLSHCPEGDELKAGVAALTALCRRAPKPEPIRALLLEGLAKADAPHKAALLQVTPAVAAAPALETVTRELSNPDAAVRTAAVRALSEWPDPAALPALKDLTTKATDEVAYVLAFRGYVRLLQVGDQPAAARVALYDEALTLARRVDERRLVLAALGALKDRAAFPKLLPPLQDPGLQAEAAAGILRLAQDVRDDDAVRALREVLKVSKDEAFVKRVRELLAELTKNAGCVVTWDVSGPYTEGNKGLTELHEVAFPPETDPATAQWQTAKAEADGRLDLVKLLGGSNRCAYMRCQVVVDAAMDASLTVGSDDGVKAWLNGKVVLDKNVPRPFKWGEDTVPVSLVQGANLLLLKVTQGGGDWMANARVAGADGIAVDGLRFETVAPAAPTPPATP